MNSFCRSVRYWRISVWIERCLLLLQHCICCMQHRPRRPAHARLPASAFKSASRTSSGHSGLRPVRAAGERTASCATMSHATVADPDCHHTLAVVLQGAICCSHHANQRAIGAAAAGSRPRARCTARLPWPRLPHGASFARQTVMHHSPHCNERPYLTLVSLLATPGASGPQLAVRAYAELLRRNEPELHRCALLHAAVWHCHAASEALARLLGVCTRSRVSGSKRHSDAAIPHDRHRAVRRAAADRRSLPGCAAHPDIAGPGADGTLCASMCCS